MNCAEIRNWNFLLVKVDSSWIESCCAKHNSFLVDYCLRKLLNDAQKEPSNSSVVFQCTNALARIAGILRNENIYGEFVEDLLYFVLQFIEFSLDVVRHACVNILDDLLHLHALQCAECKSGNKMACEWIQKIFRILSEEKALSAFGLRGVSRIVHFVGVEKAFLPDAFFSRLYEHIGNPTLSNVIFSLVADDLCFVRERSDFHLAHIKAVLVHENASIRFAVRQRLWPSLLKVSRLQVWFMENFFALLDLPQCSPYFLESELTLAKFAILHQKTIALSYGWSDFLPLSVLLGALFANNNSVKLIAWDLLCDHPKKSRPFSDSELDVALRFLSCNFAEQSPQVRQKIFDLLEKLLCRLRLSCVRLLKSVNDEPVDKHTIAGHYETFLRRLKRLAFHYLSRKSANFNRRISALSLVHILFCGNSLAADCTSTVDLRQHFGMSEWLEVDDITALLASLKDDFQLCQETAFRVLISSKLPPDSFDFSNFVRDTKKELRDGKASLNVSGNYRLRLLCAKFPREIAPLFDEMLAKCERLLDAQSDERLHILRWIQDREDETNSPRGKRTNSGLPPPYAVLSAIEDLLRIHFQLAHTGELSPRSNIQDFALKIRTRLTSVCLEFARIVTPVCHSLSPEGFLPPEVFNTLGVDSDINLLEKMHVNSAQKLLVCCWRTHKCVSTLFALLISNASHSDYLDASMLCKIGDYLWLQLTECRHCGAFECAAQAFDTFCRHLWKCEFAHVSLVHWLNKSMDAISGKNDTDKLCSTRRSAGLPHLMSVILTTAKVGKQFPHLDAVVSKLLACRSLKPAFEIHCVNVLRALFANSALSEAMLTYAETAFGVSFSGCGATNWPVRNAHCQLFAALMERVFGIPKSAQRTLHVQNACKMTSFNFFTRHSSLYSRILDIFNDLLANPRHRSQFNLFPILILLTHLHPSAVNLEAKFPLRRFTPGLLALIGSSPVQKLRELAAAALISTTFEEEIVKILRIFCAQIDTPFRRISNNFFDGLLHIINFMTELHLTISSASSYIVCSVLQRLFDAFTGNYHCANGIDYTLNSTLVNIQRVGSDSLKRYVIERMLTAFDRLDFGAWHCVCRPMGALIAEFYREFWSHVTTSNSNHWPLRLKETLDEIRYEAFRAFIFYDLPIIDFDSDPTTNRILVDLVDDLGDCKVERYLEFIIKLLLRHRDDIKHFPFVCEAIQHAEKNCLCPNNRLNLIRLKYWFRKNSDEASFDKSEMIKIIGNILTSSDDEYTRMAAFNVAIEILESMPLLTNLLEEICIALKDESGEIRNHASTCLMRYFFNPSDSKFVGASLNAELCWSFALERFPNLTTRLLHKREDQSVKNSDIFDASPANIYAEDFGVFEFDEIKKYLNA